MIDLIFGLHLYQPPNQTPDIIKKITEESYLPVIELILKYPCARFTVDIARSAVEKLENYDSGKKFLKRFQKAVDLQRVVLTNTAAYHPILPLLPRKEISRQSLLNEGCYKNLMQDGYRKPEGFFPPEMAFSQKLSSILGELGYQWTIAADTPFVCCYNHNPDPPFNWIPKQKNLAVFLRSDFWSGKIAFGYIPGNIFAKELKQEINKWFGGERGYLIIWLDWETFGHHKPHFIESFLAPFLDNLGEEINLCSPSELISIYPTKEIFVPPGTWSTSTEDFKHKNYWPLWKSPGNEFHQLWWQLAGIILEIKKNVKSEKDLALFDKAIYSCQTWQWSMRNKELARSGLRYFYEILKLPEAKNSSDEMEKIIARIKSL